MNSAWIYISLVIAAFVAVIIYRWPEGDDETDATNNCCLGCEFWEAHLSWTGWKGHCKVNTDENERPYITRWDWLCGSFKEDGRPAEWK